MIHCLATSPAQVYLLAISRLALVVAICCGIAMAQIRLEDNFTVSASLSRPCWLWFSFAGVVSLLIVVLILGMRTYLARLKKKQAEHEVLFRRLIESQESERKRLSRELHDSLSQSLVLVKNQADTGLNSMDQKEDARGDLREHFAQISGMTSLALDEIREITQNLRPNQLERLGLTNAIEQMLRYVSDSSNIEFIIEIDNIDGLLPKESEINLYRVVQECINNVLRHSAATTSWLSIKRIASGAEIVCRDNGIGFDSKVRPLTSGIGLISIGERVRMLGGRLTIESAVEKGATIRILIEKVHDE